MIHLQGADFFLQKNIEEDSNGCQHQAERLGKTEDRLIGKTCFDLFEQHLTAHAAEDCPDRQRGADSDSKRNPVFTRTNQGTDRHCQNGAARKKTDGGHRKNADHIEYRLDNDASSGSHQCPHGRSGKADEKKENDNHEIPLTSPRCLLPQATGCPACSRIWCAPVSRAVPPYR